MEHTGDALWRMIEELHPASFAWARACAGSEGEAEDVLQTVYEKIADGRAVFGGRSALKTWLFGVIRWTAQERRRKWFRRRIARTSAAPPSPEQNAAQRQLARALIAALAELPERQRQVVHLVFYEDLTVEAAAEAMGVSVGTARQHYDRAKKRLAQILGEKGLAT